MKLSSHILAIFLLINSAHSVALEEDGLDQSPEKSMVVIIPSYNNQQWYERNLQSVLSQNYTNFRVIYTDDCSCDGTGELVEQYLIDHDVEQKVDLVRNQVRGGPLYNIYSMVHGCEDDEIVVMVDGDDWFPDNEVLLRLNAVYSSDEIWMTYGQFKSSSSGACGWAIPMPEHVVKSNSFRSLSHIPTHLKTFYAWLFKQIKLEDLLYMGKFYSMAGDCAMMFPLIEMAGKRHQFIADIMYVYNDQNIISEHHRSRQLQVHLAQTIQKRKRYTSLSEKPLKRDKNSGRADVIVFAETPGNLIELLESLKTYVGGVDHIFVMYKPQTLRERNKYRLIRAAYPDVEFDEIDEEGTYFGDILFDIYLEIENDYILFIKGDASFYRAVSMSECIDALENTGAYAFYFELNAESGAQAYQRLPLLEYKNNFYMWTFAAGTDRWASANSLGFVLHRKRPSLASTLENYYGSDVSGIEAVWANEGQLDRIGLCFNESHVTRLS
jgi:glycosyltransferase involved in cell wall biosynthesis